MAKNDNGKARATRKSSERRLASFNFTDIPQETHARIIQSSQEVVHLPKIDLHDASQVEDRLVEYMGICAKYGTRPTVSGMALSLGMNRQVLSSIVHDKPIGGHNAQTALPTLVTDLLKKHYNTLELQMEGYMMTGQINPVTGIFLSKNNFGYVDKVEHEVTASTKSLEEYDKQSIQDRYVFDSTPTLEAGDSTDSSDSAD